MIRLPAPRKFRSDELDAIELIATRAVGIFASQGISVDPTDIRLDMMACHSKTRLNLDDLLAADDFNFLHDVVGINRHLDRQTYELRDCFLPRFAKV